MLGLDFKTPKWLNFDWIYMDYEGQKSAEQLYQRIILFFATIGFVAGYALQQFSYTVGALGVGSVVAAIVCGIPWSTYRKHPLKWQPVQEEDLTEDASAPLKSEGKKKKKK
jgi:signal peptidase complex subunit 1